MLELLQQAEKRIVGIKQTEKAVLRGQAETVFIAADADDRVTSKLQQLCQEQSIRLVTELTMQEIGRACGIQVKAGAAVILKD